MDFGKLQATAVVRKNSIPFVEQMFALYAARRPLVLVNGTSQADQLPGIEIDRCIDPGDQTGWLTAQHPVILDDLPAQVSYTSGTEGLPKGILLTYRNLGYTTERIIDVMQMTSEIREYVGVPATFSFGMARFRAVSAVGGQAYMPPRGFDPMELSRMLKAGQVNALSAVPTLLRILLADPAIIGDAGKALRWLEIGSQAMTAEEKRQIRAMFPKARIVQHYGLTEASRSTFLVISDATDAQLDSVGHPVGQGEVALSADGRIRIRGPQVARSRIDAAGLHDLTDADGWLQTNDLGHFLDGHLYFDGRADDLINCGGQKIVPDQLEDRIRARLKPGLQIAVAKVPDAQRGDGVLVALTGNPDQSAKVKEAATAALAEMGISAGNALHVMALDTLPVTGTGKVQRRVLAEQFALRKVTAPPATAKGEITDVRSLFQHEFPGQPIDQDDTFESLGGDSLHYIAFSLAYESRFGQLPDDWEKLTVAALQSHAEGGSKSTWRRLETVTLTRAFFMVCIVALHTEAFVYSNNWGAAYFLVMLAGYSVARFQLPEILRSGSTKTLWGTIRYVAIPTILMGVFLELVTRKFELPELLLISNYFDPNTISGYTFYFVEFYIQILILAALLFSFAPVRRAFAARPMASAVAFFAFTAALDYVIELKWTGDYNFDRTPWHYGWCFALGMVLASARDLPSRLFALALSLVTIFAYWHFTSAAFYVAGGVAAVLFIRTLIVPAPVKVLIAEIAGASMFMYLTHYQMISLVDKVFGQHMPWLALLLSIITGIIGAHLYAWAEKMVLQPRRQTVPAE
ncbi:AMP-binding protein [Rhodobacter sp. SY28-1]|uniref:AMP-binding protein n=1 Tax=Rhodobacter sp. SY28-1 TaxID=2562317 RepID=UPI0010C1547B|nr:AMP-binding protein [Rhodobacter sp. SY28-1]